MRIAHEEMVHIDIETRSYIDLRTHGVYVYADPNWTDILFACYALGEGPIATWRPWCEPMPDDLRGYFEDDERLLAAHNAQFERLLFNRVGTVKYDVPPTAIERWYCTLHQMSVNNIPESLANAGRALHTKMQKDARGTTLIRLLSRPQDDAGTFNEDADLYQEFGDYCVQDVETERAIGQVTRLATKDEMLDYWACEHINDRGIQIDRRLAECAVHLADDIAADAETQVQRLTGGAVKKPRGKVITDWVYERLPSDGQVLMTKQVKNKDTGQFEDKKTLDKNAREALISWDGLHGLEREVVELAESVGSGSVKKFTAMLNGVEADDRVRGSYSCSGASATGRYSARRIQMHNFSRDTYADPEPIIDTFIRTGELPDSPMLAMKRLLRPALKAAPGKVFVCSDWSAIEGRGLPWLTLDDRCEPKLNLFRNNEDVYLVTASDIYNETITEKKDPRRQVGKVAELALGYQGAVGSFRVMGANYGVHLPEPEILRVVHQWRAANPGIVAFWADLENASLKAVDKPGTMHTVGRVSFLFNEDLLNGTLWCRLPSGRLLSYTHCRIGYNRKFDKYGLTSLNAGVAPKVGEREWTRRGLYGGLLAENITQAVCADLLREAIRALVKDGHPVVAHTHDEIMLEVDQPYAKDYLEILEDYMLYLPDWATDLPLAVESWVGPRYRK